MRVDEQVAEIERECEAVIKALKKKLGRYRFQRLGGRQFEDAGKVCERRGSRAVQLFVQSKLRESRRREEEDYRRLLDVVGIVSNAKLDIHLKGFILRKLPSILPEHFR